MRHIVLLSVLGLGGCANPLLYADPGEITLAKAMDQTACALATYQNSLAAFKTRPGTFTDTIEATFVVKGSAKNNSDLVLDANFGAAGPLSSLGLNYSNKNETTGERGNTVKLVMRNMYTVSLNKAGERVVSKQGPGLAKYQQDVYYDRPCDPNDRLPRGINQINSRAVNAAELAAGRE